MALVVYAPNDRCPIVIRVIDPALADVVAGDEEGCLCIVLPEEV